jgi:hypothetical protein
LEIYFSVTQRKVLAPNGFDSPEAIRDLLLQKKHYEKGGKAFSVEVYSGGTPFSFSNGLKRPGVIRRRLPNPEKIQPRIFGLGNLAEGGWNTLLSASTLNNSSHTKD